MEYKLNEEDPRAVLETVFESMREGSPGITLDSLRALCNKLDLRISEEELAMMIEEADKDRDGVICEAEFMEILFSS